MSLTDSKITKIQTSFQALSQVAPALNAASDNLTKTVAILDEALKKLNVGLTVWVTFRMHGVEDWEYDNDQIGYAKLEGKWGIALRRIWGDTNGENCGGDGPWLFNDAPRELRLQAVDKIPELIEALNKAASDATEKIQAKTKDVLELAEAIIPDKADTKAKALTPAQRIAASQKSSTVKLSDMMGRDGKEGSK